MNVIKFRNLNDNLEIRCHPNSINNIQRKKQILFHKLVNVHDVTIILSKILNKSHKLMQMNNHLITLPFQYKT